jgi:flagellar biosynthesis protein FlhG
VISLNLACALRQLGHEVCLLDANLGLGSIDLLCGLNGYWNLSHVVSGARTVAEILLAGPAGIHVVPGASGLVEVADCSAVAQRDILAQLDDLEGRNDYLIIDTGTGIHRLVRHFVAAAETVIVLATPEPTAIADAYAMLKALSASREISTPHILVNQAESPEQAREIIARMQQTARTFLHTTVASAGFVPRDPAVAQAVYQRRPFVLEDRGSAAARAIEQLARRVVNLAKTPTSPGTFFSRVKSRLEPRPGVSAAAEGGSRFPSDHLQPQTY